MTFQDYQNFLGKNPSVVFEILGNDFEKEYIDNNLSFKLRNPDLTLYSLPIEEVRIISHNQKISSLRFYFDEIINREFYDDLIKDYGFPEEINVIDNVQIISTDSINNSSTSEGKYIEKRFLTTKNGSFEDRPLSIIWKNDNFEMTLFFQYNLKTTQIILAK